MAVIMPQDSQQMNLFRSLVGISDILHGALVDIIVKETTLSQIGWRRLEAAVKSTPVVVVKRKGATTVNMNVLDISFQNRVAPQEPAALVIVKLCFPLWGEERLVTNTLKKFDDNYFVAQDGGIITRLSLKGTYFPVEVLPPPHVTAQNGNGWKYYIALCEIR